MPYTLTDDQRALLERIHTSGLPAEARRAEIILLSADGITVAEIAEAVELSERQVHHWRRKWRNHGADIFTEPDEPTPAAESAVRDEPPVTEPTIAEARELFDTAPPDEPAEAGASLSAVPLEAIAEADTPPAPRPGIDTPRLPLELREEVGMLPDDPMAEAGRKALHFHFERMLLNEPGSRLGEDIEAVHDMRVATRRMRSAFRLFDPFFKSGAIKPHIKGLRRVARALGEVRDLDVMFDAAQDFADKRGDTDLGPLFNAWDKRRRKARAALIDHLDSKAFRRFVKDFDDFLTTPGAGAKKPGKLDGSSAYQVRHIAPRLVYEHLERVRAYEPVIETAVETADLDTLHALRIDFKRLRYTLEFFEEVLGPEVKAVIKTIKGMQDHLGDLNDARVVGAVLRAFVDRHHAKYSGVPLFMRPNIAGVMAYAAAQEEAKHHLLDTFPAAWAKFTGEETRRNLALGVAAL